MKQEIYEKWNSQGQKIKSEVFPFWLMVDGPRKTNIEENAGVHKNPATSNNFFEINEYESRHDERESNHNLWSWYTGYIHWKNIAQDSL